jgi:YihY family inner membrane protein
MMVIMPSQHSASFRTREGATSLGVIAHESVAGFLRNGGFRNASSLAFYTALALVPSLLLLTHVLSLGIGHSQIAMLRTEAFVRSVIPRFSEVILAELTRIARDRAPVGLINAAVLPLSLLPLVAAMRSSIASIFQVYRHHPLWLAKVIDLVTVLIFVTGIAAVASLGVVSQVLRAGSARVVLPNWLGFTLPITVSVLLLMFMFFVLAPRVHARHLLAGSLTTTTLWFALRPAFGLFLTYNPGYGYTFGSFKSLFVVIIWLYYSQAAFLFGAEVMAAMHRQDAIFIRRLMQGRGGVPVAGRERFVVLVPGGATLFREAEDGVAMYYLLRGLVSIRKDEKEISVIAPGEFFGEMSFLLGHRRTATAVALGECQCIVIDDRNIHLLMREFPEIIREMLREMAGRLRETSNRVVA